MTAHSDRYHAVWSASSTAANWTCAGRMAMVSISPDDKKSIYAAEGTAAHEVAEKALRGDLDCSKFLGEVYNIDGFDVEVTEELARSAQTYVHYVASQTDVAAGSVLLIEERHSLAQLNPPFDAGGTCDATIIKPHLGEIEVVDLKNGRGIVEVNGNKQTRTYALLALLNAPKDLVNQIDRVKVTIVQPRAPHKDGRIRSETFHIAELIEWTSELMKAMDRSALALEAFNMINGSRTMFDEWASKVLTPGNCTFCPALGICPAVRKQSLSVAPEIAKTWFEDTTLETVPMISNTVPALSPEELSHILDGIDMLEDWAKAVRATAHSLAESGVTIPGYKLVDKISNRKWAADDEKIVADLKSVIKLTEDQIFSRKLLSPAQIEKIIGAKRKEEIKNMYHNPVTGTNLVSEKKSTRPATKAKTESFFEPVKD
jgi:hypothetical protein